MAVYLNGWTGLAVGAVLISLYLLLYFFLKGRKTAVLLSYLAFQSLLFIGAANQILLDIFFYSGIYQPWVVWLVDYGVAGLVQSFSGLAWLIFCLFYTQNRLGKSKRAVVYLSVFLGTVLAVSLFDSTFVLIPNASGRHLLYNRFWSTCFYYLPVITATGCAVYGSVLLYKQAAAQHGNLRKQLLLVITAVLGLLSMEAMHFLASRVTQHPWKLPDVNFRAVGYFVSALLLAVSIVKYRFLDVVPVAIRKIVDSMREAFIVVDHADRIIDTNRAFLNRFGDYLPVDGGDFKGFLGRLERHLIKDKETSAVLAAMRLGAPPATDGELCLRELTKDYFVVHVQPLILDAQNCLGRVISFSDITAYRSLVAELAVANERNRFAGDIHDTLGHTMVTLITQLKVIGLACEADPGKAREKISEALIVAKNGLQELRCSIAGLQPESLAHDSLAAALANLAQNFREAGVEVTLTVDGHGPCNPDHAPVLYRVCQEALTNALRHGNAQKVTIAIRFLENATKVFIADNGLGCSDPKKGYGLRGMEQRIRELHGSLKWGSGDAGGFSVFVEIPNNAGASGEGVS